MAAPQTDYPQSWAKCAVSFPLNDVVQIGITTSDSSNRSSPGNYGFTHGTLAVTLNKATPNGPVKFGRVIGLEVQPSIVGITASASGTFAEDAYGTGTLVTNLGDHSPDDLELALAFDDVVLQDSARKQSYRFSGTLKIRANASLAADAGGAP